MPESVDFAAKDIAERITRAQQKLHSGEITQVQYDSIFDGIMQSYELRVMNIIQK